MTRTGTSSLALGVGIAVIGLLLSCASAADASASDEVSFRNDVMPVLSRAGCNAGACHGNKTGKGGFKLSLRGEDPSADFEVLTRDLAARRTNPLEPDKSLILLKPTTQLPHEGGLRIAPDSLEYRILHAWITQGVPGDSAATPVLVRLEVEPAERVLSEPERELKIRTWAHFSDGSRRDVSRLAVYEQSNVLAAINEEGVARGEKNGETTVIVRYQNRQEPVRLTFLPARTDFTWDAPATSNLIDEHVFAKLRTMRIHPSRSCSDSEFLRRAYLDLLGILPTPEETRAFLDDADSEKRARLVDALLERPEFAEFWALKWADLFKVEERALDRKGVQAFHRWITRSIAENKPLDAFAREIVSARGSTYENPPANYYRANRNAIERAESTAQVFLGTRLQCAQCHNHPFDRWTMDDYYSWAAVFGGIDYKVIENRRRDSNDTHEFAGEQIVFVTDRGSVKDARTGKPAKPRYLGDAPSESNTSSARNSLDDLAAWMTAPENPLFARAQANRIWFHLMGRGIVDPIDDFRATNPPSHPQLLDALAADFVDHRYDLRRMIRLIMSSTTYALSSEPNQTNADDATNYSHNLPRRLTAEQLLDAQHQFMAVPAEFLGYPAGMRAGQIPGLAPVRRRTGTAETFLAVFGKPARLLACDCERSTDATMPQTFQMVSGPLVTKLLAHQNNRVARLLRSNLPSSEMIDELYLASLSRYPTITEREEFIRRIDGATDKRHVLEDIAWAILNSKEFILRK
jgi:hypothetical protein